MEIEKGKKKGKTQASNAAAAASATLFIPTPPSKERFSASIDWFSIVLRRGEEEEKHLSETTEPSNLSLRFSGYGQGQRGWMNEGSHGTGRPMVPAVNSGACRVRVFFFFTFRWWHGILSRWHMELFPHSFGAMKCHFGGQHTWRLPFACSLQSTPELACL